MGDRAYRDERGGRRGDDRGGRSWRGRGSGRGGGARRRLEDEYEHEHQAPAPAVQLLMRRADSGTTQTTGGASTPGLGDDISSSSAAAVNPFPLQSQQEKKKVDTALLLSLTGGRRTTEDYSVEQRGVLARRGGGRGGGSEAPRHGAPGVTSRSLHQEKAAAEAAANEQLGGVKVMRDAVKLVSETSDFMERNFVEYLSDTNVDFRVVAAIGPQTTGKSTLLSMLAGNQPLDLFRQYVFRPSSREACEFSKFQTTKVAIYVSKKRNIFIDCQPTDCASLLLETVPKDRPTRRDQEDTETKLRRLRSENLHIISWVLQVSHSVLVCSDWFIDMDLVRTLRTAEMIRAAHDEIQKKQDLPPLNLARKTHIIWVQVRARSNECIPGVVASRAKVVQRLFSDAMRIKLVTEPLDADVPGPAPVEGATIYMPLSEMRLRDVRKEETPNKAHGFGSPGGSSSLNSSRDENRHLPPGVTLVHIPGHIHHNHYPPSTGQCPPPATFEKEEGFDEGMITLRKNVLYAPVDAFAEREEEALTEKMWLRYTRAVWMDSTARNTLQLLEEYLRPIASRPSTTSRGTPLGGVETDTPTHCLLSMQQLSDLRLG